MYNCNVVLWLSLEDGLASSFGLLVPAATTVIKSSETSKPIK